MNAKTLVGTATRYIAGRNAMQSVYWKARGSGNSDSRMIKVSKTLRFEKSSVPPQHVQTKNTVQFN